VIFHGHFSHGLVLVIRQFLHHGSIVSHVSSSHCAFGFCIIQSPQNVVLHHPQPPQPPPHHHHPQPPQPPPHHHVVYVAVQLPHAIHPQFQVYVVVFPLTIQAKLETVTPVIHKPVEVADNGDCCTQVILHATQDPHHQLVGKHAAEHQIVHHPA